MNAQWTWERTGGNSFKVTRRPSQREWDDFRWANFWAECARRKREFGFSPLAGIQYEAECRMQGIEP